MQQLAALGRVTPALGHAAFAKVTCGCVPHAPQPHQQTLSVIGGIIPAIGIGQQGPKNGPEFTQWVPVFMGACQSAQLQPQDQPDGVSAALGQQTLAAQARGDALAALALVLVEDDDPCRSPSRGDGPIHQSLWPGRGSTGSTTCCGGDWRTDTIAWRRRGWSRSFDPTPLRAHGGRAGAVIRHLLESQKAVPDDSPSQDRAQIPSMLCRHRLPPRRRRYLLRLPGVRRMLGRRRGGGGVGLHRHPLLRERRADVDTIVRALTRPIH